MTADDAAEANVTTRDLDILVLEDEAFIAMDLKTSLRRAGHTQVRLCATAAAAMEAIETRTPAVGLLDINLGRGETSFDVAETLKREGCEIVFLSGYTAATVPLPEGFADVPRLAKPFDAAKLRALLSSFTAR